MKRIIIGDSGLDLNPNLEKTINIKLVPFFIDLDENHYIDDGSLDIISYLKQMKNSKNVPKTAAPSPDSFFRVMQGYEEIFVVTISSKLSTTYNNAIIAKNMYIDENPNVKVHIFDSKTAASGETGVAIKIQELIDLGKNFEEIVEEVEKHIEESTTLFILEDLGNLIKNGRMSKLSGKIASVLSIYPICAGVNGSIEVMHKVRGMKSAISKMIEMIGENICIHSQKTLVIEHINNEERAFEIKNKIESLYKFKSIEIITAKGLASTYANDGGIVLAY